MSPLCRDAECPENGGPLAGWASAITVSLCCTSLITVQTLTDRTCVRILWRVDSGEGAGPLARTPMKAMEHFGTLWNT